MSSTRARLAASIFCAALVLGGCSDQPVEQAPAQATSAQAAPSVPAQSAPAPSAQPASAPAAETEADVVKKPVEIADGEFLPLPVTPYPASRPMEVVNAVFRFAARRPDVLSRVPCFCGCERMGHRGNDDCFVKARDARGRPTEWEEHGLG